LFRGSFIDLFEGFNQGRGGHSTPNMRRIEKAIWEGHPLLIVSRFPLSVLQGRDDQQLHDFVVIDLSDVATQDQLAGLIDGLITAGVNSEQDVLPRIPDVARRSGLGSSGRSHVLSGVLEEGLELKPNVMGIGLNINGLIRLIRQRLEETHRTEVVIRRTERLEIDLLLRPRCARCPAGPPRRVRDLNRACPEAVFTMRI
jgi:hypothetical protein